MSSTAPENTSVPQADKKQVLHVGCGFYKPEKLHASFRNDEWQEIRLDINPLAKPDIVADMKDMSSVASESVDAVWSSHNLEHLYAHEVPVALNEFWRVLRLGGHVLITLPDIQKLGAAIAAGDLEEAVYMSPAGPICPIDILYGHRPSIEMGNTFMAHKTGFTMKTLGQKLVDAGFEKVRVESRGFDLWATGFKLKSSENS